MRVLSFGALNIDYVYEVDNFVKKGETISAQSLKLYCGGKSLNQSIALAKAGCFVYQAGIIGEDGLFLLAELKKATVNTDLVLVDVRNKSGNAFIQKEKSGDNCIVLYGGTNQMVNTDYIDRVLSEFSAGDCLVLQNEINNIDYLMRKGREKAMFIVMNPSPMNQKVITYPLNYADILILKLTAS